MNKVLVRMGRDGGDKVRPRFLADGSFALAFAAVALVDVWRPELAVWGDDPVAGPRVLNTVLLLAVTLPVAWRRTAPLAATAVCMTGVSAQAALTGQPPIGLVLVGPVIALVYAVAAHGSRRQAMLGLALTAGATAIHDLLDPRIQTATDVGEASYWWLVIAMTWVLGLYSGSRRRAREAADLARHRESEHARAAEQAVIRERIRIAHELHDIVAHNVSVIALQSGAALELLDQAPERAREPLLAIEGAAQGTLVEMRSLLGLLRSSEGQGQGEGQGRAMPQPGLDDLPALAARVTAAGLPVQLVTHGRPRVVTPGQGLSAYRIVQESLTNALKHSVAPTEAVVSVRFEPGELRLSITDDGDPPDPPDLPDLPVHGRRGHGLVGMRERAVLHGGDLHAGPCPEGGFRVDARLPDARATP